MVSKFSSLVATSLFAGAAMAQITEITACNFHGATQFCVDNSGGEGYVSPAPTNTADAPRSYTGCHNHGEEVHCANGEAHVYYIVEGDEEEVHTTADSVATSSSAAPASATVTTAAPTSSAEHDHDHDHDHDHEEASSAATTTAATMTTSVISSAGASSAANESATTISQGGANSLAAGVFVGAAALGALLI